MVAMPPAMPFTMPLDEPILAMVGSLLVQMPPVAVLLNVDEVPAQNVRVPVIDEGNGVIVTVRVVVTVQPWPLLTVSVTG